MTDQTDPREAEFEQANASLAQGLESCRALLKNYQTMLGDAAEAANDSSLKDELDHGAGASA